METNTKTILTDKLELYIMELPKIIGKEKEQDKLLDWLYFIDNPKSERVTKKMGENEELKEAVEELGRISEDEKMQRIADLREKAILDEKAIYAKGIEVGEEKGINRRNIEIAKELIKEGMPKIKISHITGLTIEEIEKL